MIRRPERTDAQWAKLEPLLPSQRPAPGRPAHDHRTIVNGILWRLKTGVPWRDRPARYGPWPTVSSRVRRWQQAGVWARGLAARHAAAAAAGDFDWPLHVLDGTTIRAHQSAAGATKGAAIRRSAARGAAFRPKFTAAARGPANRSPSS